MDTSDPDIKFDNDGVCMHCRIYEKRASHELRQDEIGQEKLNGIVSEIKRKGKNKKYDCLIGVSGGTDSTMVAYLVKKELGLRPLAIHLDNGWNTETSVGNIERTLKTLDIDLYTYVLDWEEFKDLHLAFLKSSISNSEIPTDHAITAVLYHTAADRRIPYIIGGSNIVTEAIMPSSWMYDATDWRLIKHIHKKFGKIKLKGFPHLSLFHWAYFTFIKNIKYISILNYVNYVKKDAMKLLEKEIGWKYYGGKHYESIYTRFFQGYILPKKYNIDKRKAHFSTLICSGQMTRAEALKEMKKDIYPLDVMQEDKNYFIKKFELTEKEFENIMSLPIKTYKDYPNNDVLFKKFHFLVKYAKKLATFN